MFATEWPVENLIKVATRRRQRNTNTPALGKPLGGSLLCGALAAAVRVVVRGNDDMRGL